MRSGTAHLAGEEAACGAAFVRFAALWKRRLSEGWTPPPGSRFPWAQVRLSLAALLPGMGTVSGPKRPPTAPETQHPAPLTALVLAGNTPLLAWPALTAALAAGQRVVVKMSQDETLWPGLFVETLEEMAPEIAARVQLNVWPGEDARTAALVQAADAAVIAYGSDAAVAALRAVSPAGVPFFGFGHALSVGLVLAPGEGDEADAAVAAARGFARDVLMYDQQGCLSPQTIFVAGGAGAAWRFAERLAAALPDACKALDVAPVDNPGVARAVRSARDLALFESARVLSDPALRWTVASAGTSCALPTPVGHGWVSVVPLGDLPPERLPERFGAARGRVSSVGVAGSVSPELRAALTAAGISRICAPGEMQTPPLDWPNAGIDLFAELRRV